MNTTATFQFYFTSPNVQNYSFRPSFQTPAKKNFRETACSDPATDCYSIMILEKWYLVLYCHLKPCVLPVVLGFKHKASSSNPQYTHTLHLSEIGQSTAESSTIFNMGAIEVLPFRMSIMITIFNFKFKYNLSWFDLQMGLVWPQTRIQIWQCWSFCLHFTFATFGPLSLRAEWTKLYWLCERPRSIFTA